MWNRRWRLWDVANWAATRIGVSRLQVGESGSQFVRDCPAQPASLLTPRRRICLCLMVLTVLVAALGETAALAAASALDFGVTETGLALAGVALSAIWPLARTAP